MYAVTDSHVSRNAYSVSVLVRQVRICTHTELCTESACRVLVDRASRLFDPIKM
jgi:hypothetical protein